jgi:hypothetical protein
MKPNRGREDWERYQGVHDILKSVRRDFGAITHGIEDLDLVVRVVLLVVSGLLAVVEVGLNEKTQKREN